ncbi:hypothetical protein AKJ57_02325 [candidate division MSBL1 archaeon SCGC-AAA259A05]|uniref:DUF1232 domain-containing protein n=1 Tax=candidate division MSBL1 archaeon SCGC-AAA259A05 TaxID=1698259 RepID=A0A133UAD1_9EURY|nr:hypothetical protein AKJ57_02325 [candidate division MSBL1 archaeon SCGC-AAA259A05]
MRKFDGVECEVKKKKGFVATCECGWESDEKRTKEEAIISFEDHVRSNPSHHMFENEEQKNFFSIFLGILGFVYVVSPIDLVPDYLIGIGWLEDILIGVLSIFLIKKGVDGRSPTEIFSEIFK